MRVADPRAALPRLCGEGLKSAPPPPPPPPPLPTPPTPPTPTPLSPKPRPRPRLPPPPGLTPASARVTKAGTTPEVASLGGQIQQHFAQVNTPHKQSDIPPTFVFCVRAQRESTVDLAAQTLSVVLVGFQFGGLRGAACVVRAGAPI